MSSELDILSEVQKLAALSPLEYEAQRKPAAKALSLRLPALDAEVAKHRPPPLVQARESLAPPPPKPWPAPVEARALLDDLRVYVERFVVVDEHALSAITLWVAFSYCFEVAETSPRLAIGSPTKRCGKTRLLELLSLLCPQAIAASNLTPSAIFRTIDAESCVLLIDEADTLDAASKSELRGILNSGHTRATAFVIRNVPVGERHWEPKKFSTWAPIAHAAIGRLPDTWRDRSVEIRMRRKPRTQTVERLTRRNVAAREQAATLASKLARFAADNLEALRNATPEPAELDSDRAVDNWELMLAIADLAGEQWPERAGAAAVALSRDGQASADDSPPILMLADIGEVFEDHFGENIGSTELCDRLNARELSPWSTFARGKGLTAARLARMLKDFEIYPRKSAARNEYLRGDFSEAFTRYVPVPPSQGSIAPQTLGRARRNAIPEVPSDGALKSAETRTESGSSGTMEVPDGGMGVDHDFPAGEEDGIGGEDEGPL